MRISDWSSDVCSSDLFAEAGLLSIALLDIVDQGRGLDPAEILVLANFREQFVDSDQQFTHVDELALAIDDAGVQFLAPLLDGPALPLVLLHQRLDDVPAPLLLAHPRVPPLRPRPALFAAPPATA